MFARSVAKQQTKASESPISNPAHRQSTDTRSRAVREVGGSKHEEQRIHPALAEVEDRSPDRLLDPETRSPVLRVQRQLPAMESVAVGGGATWDLSRVAIIPPEWRATVERPLVSPTPASPTIQPKFEVGTVDDPLEHEADRVADQVTRLPDPEVSVAVAPPQDSPRSPAAEAGPGAGGPLPSLTRAFFEARFGYDFSQVRVHAGGEAAHAARSLGARAYTFGRDIAFAPGEYAPTTDSGKRLLAHELTHVVQQGVAGPSLAGTTPVRAAGGAAPAVQRESAPSATVDRPTAQQLIQKFLETAPTDLAGLIIIDKVWPALVGLSNAATLLPGPREGTFELSERIKERLGRPGLPKTPSELAAVVARLLPIPFPRKPLVDLHIGASGPKETTWEKAQKALKGTRSNTLNFSDPDKPSTAGQRNPGQEADKNLGGVVPTGGIPLNTLVDLFKKDEKRPAASKREEPDPDIITGAPPAAIPTPAATPTSAATPAPAAAPAPATEPAPIGLGVLPSYVEAAMRRAKADGHTTAELSLGQNLKNQEGTVYGQLRFLLTKNLRETGVVAINVYFGGVLARTVRLDRTD